MKKFMLLVLISLISLSTITEANTLEDERHLRGAWISTTLNLDWPSKEVSTIEDDEIRIRESKRELIEILDKAVELNMNAIFFQVSPEGDAMYQSDIVPWSRYLTGEFGKDPGFDPLQFVVEESDKRNLEVHAWLNPYRVSMYDNRPEITDSLRTTDKSVFKDHPDWIKVANSRYVVDPGIPEAQDWVRNRVIEVLENYDVDGIHFDDYFYYESFIGELDDDSTYSMYNEGEFSSKADWRRNNTYELIANISGDIESRKAWVKFGVSPSGVWANKSDGYLDGSDTEAGLTHYDMNFIDTKKWVEDEIIDYIAPQIYFSTENEYVPYELMVNWWNDVVSGREVQLYIGQALYKINNEIYEDRFNGEDAIDEMRLQASINEEKADGSIMFRYGFFFEDKVSRVVEELKNNIWKEKTLVPQMNWKEGFELDGISNSSIMYSNIGAQMSWLDNDEDTDYYAIYRVDSGEKRLIDIVNKKSNTGSFSDASNTTDKDAIYLINALDRLHNEDYGILVGLEQSKYFLDVGVKSPWAIEAIDTLYERGTVKGIGDRLFAPNDNIRRADFLIMTMNAYDIPVSSEYDDNFSDAGDRYYTDYLGTAKQLELVEGVGDNRYLPKESISRQDMFLILYRILEKLDLLENSFEDEVDIGSFKDVEDISDYAYEAMDYFVRGGIVRGDGEYLRPERSSTRAEGAQILYNLLK